MYYRGDSMEIISLRLSSRDKKIIQDYAKIQHLTVSEFIRSVVIAKIEDEVDIQLFDQVYQPHRKTYSLKEIERDLKDPYVGD
jgi:RHH-type transcriptional regulator, rel operon repressor / antitoxin RelB